MGEFGVLVFFWPLLYLIIAGLVIKVVLYVVKGNRKKKWSIGLLLAFLFYLPLGWDVILGRAYFSYLCSTQAGVHVYEQVAIDAKYFEPDAEPNYFDPKRKGYYFKDHSFEGFNMVDGRYYVELKKANYSNQFNISERKYFIIDRLKDKTVADSTYFSYSGGWYINKGQPFEHSSKRCPPINIHNSVVDIINQVFVPKK